MNIYIYFPNPINLTDKLLIRIALHRKIEQFISVRGLCFSVTNFLTFQFFLFFIVVPFYYYKDSYKSSYRGVNNFFKMRIYKLL